MSFSRRQLSAKATLSLADLDEVGRCRRPHNQLGFGYQLAFVRLLNRFPSQEPFEILDRLLLFVGSQLELDPGLIDAYRRRRPTVSDHRQRITLYLGLRRLDGETLPLLKEFLYEEATRLEQSTALEKRAREFLAAHRILEPADSSLARLVGEQRHVVRERQFSQVANCLTPKMAQRLDELLIVQEGEHVSPLQRIKANPGQPSVDSMRTALRKLRLIEETGILEVDLAWLNSNFQRAMFHKVRKASAYRLRELRGPVRYAALACFLKQSYGDAVDQAVVLFTRLLAKIEKRASNSLDAQMRQQRLTIRSSLAALIALGSLLLDDELPDAELRPRAFERVPREELAKRVEAATEWVEGKRSDALHGVVKRYSTLRKFGPAFLEALDLRQEDGGEPGPCLQALDLLRTLNAENKRKLPPGTATEFLPRRWRRLVGSGDELNRAAWECAVMMKARDEIRSGNIVVGHSKRFTRLDDFFMPTSQWEATRAAFFARSQLPAEPDRVPAYLRERLGAAFDRFLGGQADNAFATADERGWRLSTDPRERLADETVDQLAHLKKWLDRNMRRIRLPRLLIEVDNDLRFTRHFMLPAQRRDPMPDAICTILAAVMAHGCNIGPVTMAQLTPDVTYEQLKRVGDWQLTRDSQREALAVIVNAISGLDTSLYWGEGRTSASDGQRFSLRRKVLQKTYSPRFSDFALEFYGFVADNYAPFYSTPIECTERDAAVVLDGLLYNESELEIEEHYTDTHGYTEINFAAFAMLGRQFRPRIRDIKHQRIYRVDDERDYGSLQTLVGRADRLIDVERISEQWDRIGHFYASLETGHATASVALKRLVGFTAKNRFYRANRDLGRIFKTEFILQYLSESELRTRIRRGLLKVDQMHALARDVFYGNQGRINARELWEQMNSCSCLTLIVACIIYWQAKEISRVVRQADPEGNGVRLPLLRHVSPIEWDNVVLYGEYVLDRRLIRGVRARS